MNIVSLSKLSTCMHNSPSLNIVFYKFIHAWYLHMLFLKVLYDFTLNISYVHVKELNLTHECKDIEIRVLF